jgi:uncharacterized cupredoxin-like copper-binding protein
MKKLSVRSLSTLAVVALAALAVVQVASAGASPQARASATTVQVSGKEYSFKLSKKSVSRPGKVTFVFKNNGHMQHDFSVNGKKTPMISPHKTAKVSVTFKKKGSYRYLCTVPGHAQLGMKGVFKVR